MFGGIPFASFGGGHPGMRGHPGMGGMPGGGRRPEKKEVDTTKHYETLGVEKDATPSQIKKAYLLLARKEHPDKGGDPERFKDIQHAYDILGDAESRSLYDQGGEEAVERGSASEGPRDIFEAMFGGGRRPRGPPKGEPTMHALRVSLEDLYKGKTVRLAVSRTLYTKDEAGPVSDQHGNRYSKRQERKVLEVEVEKGAREGTRITFEEAGDVIPGQLAGDVIFVVKTKDHPTFQRKGADLVMEQEITLGQALTGHAFVVNHVSGERVLVRTVPGEVIKPDSIKQVEGFGMPVHGNSFVKGCLYVKFNVTFPERLELSTSMRKALLGILPAGAPPAELEEDMEEGVLAEVDMEARRAREKLGAEADSDEDGGGGGGPGMQRVQCAHQ